MQKYVYTLCLLSGSPLIAGPIITPAELDTMQKAADKKEDTIVLLDGSTLQGTLTRVPDLHYSFGKLPVDLSHLSAIAFSGDKIQLITTRGYSYLADVPAGSILLVQYLPNRNNPKYTLHKDIAPSTIKYAILKNKEAAVSSKPIFDIELKNGDHIPASIEAETITLSTGLRDDKIKTDDLISLTMDYGIRGTTKNNQNLDYTYAKDKFLNVQAAESEHSLSIPWAAIGKIQRVESKEERPVATNDYQKLVNRLEQEIARTKSLEADLDMLDQELKVSDRKIMQLTEELEKTKSMKNNSSVTLYVQEHPETQVRTLSELDQMATSVLSLQQDLKEINAHHKQTLEELQNLSSHKQMIEKELHAAKEARDELQDQLSRQVKPEDHARVLSRLESEKNRVRNLEESLNTISTHVQITDKGTHELIAKFEAEVKELQALLSGKQREISFSEKELEKTLDDIAQWKKVQSMEAVKNATAPKESFESHVHLVSDIDHLTKSLENERKSTLTLEQTLADLQTRFNETDQKAQMLQQEYEKQMTAHKELENAYQNDRRELEEKIAFLQEAFEDGQKHLAEKENLIQTITAVKEDLTKMLQDKDTDQEHKMHMISDIEQLTTALSQERATADNLRQNLDAMQMQHQVADQKIQMLHEEFGRQAKARENLSEQYVNHRDELTNTIAQLQQSLDTVNARLAEKESEANMLSAAKTEMEMNLSSEIETFFDLAFVKQQRIEQLEIELNRLQNTDLDARIAFEKTTSELMTALEKERQEHADKARILEHNSKFAEALEAQMQALTQRAASFGDEFALTSHRLMESEKDMQELREANQYLQQELVLSGKKFNDAVQRGAELEEQIVKLTQNVKEMDQHLAKTSTELETLRSTYQNRDSELETERTRAHALEQGLLALHNQNDETSEHIQQLMADIASERELTRELGIQLQRVHQTETRYKKNIEQLSQKLSAAEMENTALKAQKTEAQPVMVDNSEEVQQLQKERDELLRQLANEKQAFAEREGLIERLSEIVKMQKNALERIERSRLALNEDEQ